MGRAQNDQFLYEPGRGGRVFAEEDAPPTSASPARAAYTGAPARKGRETFALTTGPGFQKASPVLCAICDHNGQSCTFINHWSPKAWTVPIRLCSSTQDGWRGCSPCLSRRRLRPARRGARRPVVHCQIYSATSSCRRRRCGHPCTRRGPAKCRHRRTGHPCQTGARRQSPQFRRYRLHATRIGLLACP